MKKCIFCLSMLAVIASCQDSQTEATSTSAESSAAAASTTPVDLPYKASYSSNFTTDVSDADLKTVLLSYKDWADGNLTGLANSMGDSVTVIFNDGEEFSGTKAELMKRWSNYRDSLSSITIDMMAWQKMYEPDKKEGAILTWYKEIDTYKNGKVDSAYYHDVNGVKNGKIIYYSTFKRRAR